MSLVLSRPLFLNSWLIPEPLRANSILLGGSSAFAHRLSLELNPVRAMHEAIKASIRDGRFTQLDMLDQVHHRGERVANKSAPILLYEHILRSQCLAWKDMGRLAPDWKSWVRERLKLMRGNYGFDLLFALRMPTEPTEELRAYSERYRAFQKDEYAR